VRSSKSEVEDEAECDDAEDNQVDEAPAALLLVVLGLGQLLLRGLYVVRGARHVLVQPHELLPLVLNLNVDVLGYRVDVLHN